MTQEVLFQITNKLGIIKLNRPASLNALNTDMCSAILENLLAWEKDDNIKAIVISGEGGKAFCAGGDIVMMHKSGKADDGKAEEFWRTEYALNELIQSYSKPYIALIDGIVMGGGVGLSVHGKYRVAGDKTLLAMPETGIGYFPDVGGSYFLPRLGKAIGNWAGLTGARLNASLAFQFGIATHYVPSENHQTLIDELCASNLDGGFADVDAIIAEFAKVPTEEKLPPEIKAFEHDNVEAIITALEAANTDWADAQLKTLSQKSPLALKVTFEAMQRGAHLSFREAMVQELILSINFLKCPDFYEGIRAQVIDKDRNPNWHYKNLRQIKREQIEDFFVPRTLKLEFVER